MIWVIKIHDKLIFLKFVEVFVCLFCFLIFGFDLVIRVTSRLLHTNQEMPKCRRGTSGVSCWAFSHKCKVALHYPTFTTRHHSPKADHALLLPLLNQGGLLL